MVQIWASLIAIAAAGFMMIIFGVYLWSRGNAKIQNMADSHTRISRRDRPHLYEVGGRPTVLGELERATGLEPLETIPQSHRPIRRITKHAARYSVIRGGGRASVFLALFLAGCTSTEVASTTSAVVIVTEMLMAFLMPPQAWFRINSILVVVLIAIALIGCTTTPPPREISDAINCKVNPEDCR